MLIELNRLLEQIRSYEQEKALSQYPVKRESTELVDPRLTSSIPYLIKRA